MFGKNLPGWERTARVVVGLVLVVGSLLAFPGSVAGYVGAAIGVVSVLTGSIGYCPACAIAGRRLPE